MGVSGGAVSVEPAAVVPPTLPAVDDMVILLFRWFIVVGGERS